VLLDQSCPRTEGPRFIVSRFAPLDSDLHSLPPSAWRSGNLPSVTVA
jgi:hypothetical protein